MPVSARTSAELDAQLLRLAEALTHEHDVGEVAFTLALGRRHLAARAAVVTTDVEDLRAKLAALAAGEVPAGCARGVASGAEPAETQARGDDLARTAEAYVAGRSLDWASLLPVVSFMGSWVTDMVVSSGASTILDFGFWI